MNFFFFKLLEIRCIVFLTEPLSSEGSSWPKFTLRFAKLVKLDNAILFSINFLCTSVSSKKSPIWPLDGLPEG